MARCQRNDVGSLMLDQPARTASGHHHHFRLFSAFSGAAFRRKIFDAVSCGASTRYRHNHHHHHQNGKKEDKNGVAPVEEVNEKPKTTAAPAAKKDQKAANGKSEKLMDLLNLAEWSESEAEAAATRRKVEALERMKRAVRALQAEEREKRREAARDVRLLAKEDLEARGTLSMLGAIPPLVGILDDDDDGDPDDDSHIAALYALLNLGIGNDLNKGAIVKAGAVHKMLKLIDSPKPNSLNPLVSEAIVANFLGLSALDSNKPIIGSSGAIPFLVKTLQTSSSSQAKQDSLRALFNLSIDPSNITFISETDLIPFSLTQLGDMESSERFLSILGNVVSTPEGRRSISGSRDAFPILVDVLNWNDSPGCQEKASYVLMVMAHKAYGDRSAMVEAGIVSALLELTLLGTTLAQKRASRILECLRIDKGKQVSESFGGPTAAVSAPICGTSASSSSSKVCLGEEDEAAMSEEKKAVKQLVQQSLQSNMRKIVKRANLPQDLVPSFHFKALTTSSTSKSLPF